MRVGSLSNSGNPDLAVIQQSYIDVLSGKKNTLLRPDVNEDEYKEMLAGGWRV